MTSRDLQKTIAAAALFLAGCFAEAVFTYAWLVEGLWLKGPGGPIGVLVVGAMMITVGPLLSALLAFVIDLLFGALSARTRFKIAMAAWLVLCVPLGIWLLGKGADPIRMLILAPFFVGLGAFVGPGLGQLPLNSWLYQRKMKVLEAETEGRLAEFKCEAELRREELKRKREAQEKAGQEALARLAAIQEELRRKMDSLR